MLGITGTGGSGKSSLTDELVRRIRLDQEDKLRIAVVAIVGLVIYRHMHKSAPPGAGPTGTGPGNGS